MVQSSEMPFVNALYVNKNRASSCADRVCALRHWILDKRRMLAYKALVNFLSLCQFNQLCYIPNTLSKMVREFIVSVVVQSDKLT